MQDIAFPRGQRQALQVFGFAFLLSLFALGPALLGYGGRFIVRGDYIEQQIPFLLETRRMFASGTPFWSWNSFLGGNFLGNYAFYTVGSPFVWVLLPLPEDALVYGISIVAMLKQAVAAWSTFLFLRRFVKNPRIAQLGGLLYAFSGFTIINTQFYHFTDVIAVFPLLLLGLEDAFSRKPHRGALALACALNVLVNYYFFVGTALFVVLYVIFRIFSEDWRPFRSFHRLFFVVFECGLGCLLSAVLLFPAAWAMLGISRTGHFMMFDFSESYQSGDLLERLRVLFMPIESAVQHAFYGRAASWASVGAFLPLFGMVPVLYSLFRTPRRWSHGLLLLLLAISLVMPINRLFVLGSNNTYTRWWYALVLILCVITVQALDAYDPGLAKEQRRMGGAWLFSLLFTTALFLPFLLPDSLLSPLREGDGLLRRFAEIIQQQREGSGYATDLLRWVSVGLWGVNLLCCLLVLSPGVFAKGPVVLALLSVCITLNYASFLVLNNDFQESGGHVGYVTGLDYYVEHELDQEMPHFEGTEYTHRVDYPPKLLNYGMLINQPSISNFHSIRTSYLDDFLVATGFSFSELPYAKPPDQKDGAIRTLLGVKTYYNYDEAQYPGAPDGFVSAGTDGDVSVYENAYALPIGFAYTHYTTPYRTSVYQETTGQLMLNAVVLDARNLEEYRSWIPAIEPEDLLPWQEAAEQRALMGCYDVVMDSRGLRAKIDLDETRLVFFSVPYDKGWSATVNGAPAEVKRINLGFVGLVVEAGDAIEIDLSFLPRGLREGALASLIALIVWTLYVAMGSRRKRNPATK